MTLRDWFAGHAMAAYMSDSETQLAFKAVAEKSCVDFRAAIAGASYEVADAMLAARKNQGGAIR